MAAVFNQDLAFYEQLRHYYIEHKGAIRQNYRGITKKILAYNDRQVRPEAFLRPPQFEALEMYIFFKEFLGNPQVSQAFDDWRKREGRFVDATRYSRGAAQLFDDISDKQTEKIFKQMSKSAEEYPNYIFALTMGLGKTVLMGTCIFYEFLLANKFPKDPLYCHNALVFAPDKTVLESLREIVTFDKSLVIPPEYVPFIDTNLKVHFLEESGTTLQTLDNSDFNLIISNDQKIIAKQKHKEDSAADRLFTMPSQMSEKAAELLSSVYGENYERDDSGLVLNQRFTKLCRLSQLGVYVDEAHHLFGKELVKSLTDKKNESSLRRTINLLDEELKKNNTSVIACYNFTGTPYANNTVLPEVIYAYGLKESIQRGYLKNADVIGFENVKNEQFLREVIIEFWSTYGENRYEGLLPKLAIFAATIEEVESEVKPIVEKVLSELGISTNKILVNTGESKLTKQEDIHIFNNLDNPNAGGNDKQFIILVQKGREGWNCRSLFGVALFRSPKSKVFVLQATMRCLRQITSVQQTAKVFLSEENKKILEDELSKNYNMQIRDLSSGPAKDKRTYQVRVRPPEKKIKVKRVRKDYTTARLEAPKILDFGLSEIDLDKYRSYRTDKKGLVSGITEKRKEIDAKIDDFEYSLISLVGEISRYLGPDVKCIELERMLTNSSDGVDLILDCVNLNEDILYDIIIPKVFDALYEVSYKTISEEREVSLLRTPKHSEYYEFSADPDLVNTVDEIQFEDVFDKSFHADTYCFDSKPEQQVFLQYIGSDDVEEVYFTGMFTSGQGDLSISYYDPESRSLRSYYPDFYAVLSDGTVEIIEVKGDNKLDDPTVKAKARAAEEIAGESGYVYRMISGSEAMKTDLFDDDRIPETTSLFDVDK